MIKARRILALLGCVSVLFTSACAASNAEASVSVPDLMLEEASEEIPSESPSSTPTATPEPTPSPSPAPDPEEILEALKETDILSYLPSTLYERTEGQRWYEPVLAHKEESLALKAQYEEWEKAAGENAAGNGVTAVTFESDAPSWQTLAAVISNYQGNDEALREALFEAGAFECEIVETEDGDYEAVVSSKDQTPSELFYSLPESEAATPFQLLTSYAYLSTVYDEALELQTVVPEPELEEFLFPIANPSTVYVGDCWALPRDGGARLHTGTDINAPEWTDLYAVLDGTILDNGTNPVAGNYIVLEGEDGVQYHYYHLVEPSQVMPGTKVSRGEVIANVGNTGNSRANHLHFTIITPDGRYINPYKYLAQAQTQTIAANQATTE